MAFSLGAAEQSERPAILLPWIDARGRYMALKYRFIDDLAATDHNQRFSQKPGSEMVVFGVQLLDRSSQAHTLVVIEGEFNALAVWQATRGLGFDVLSTGPRGNFRCLPFIAKLLERRPYQRALAWLDEPEDSLRALQSLPSAVPMRSPGGMDANDVLLKHGPEQLIALIEGIFERSQVGAVRKLQSAAAATPVESEPISFRPGDRPLVFGRPTPVLIDGRLEHLVRVDDGVHKAILWARFVDASKVGRLAMGGFG
jgi:hypothetical protein